MKRNIYLLLTFILCMIYIVVSLFYLRMLVLKYFDQPDLLAYIVVITLILLVPHYLCMCIGGILQGLGWWYFYKKRFVLTGCILYVIALGLLIPFYYFFFSSYSFFILVHILMVTVQMLVSFLGYLQYKKKVA